MYTILIVDDERPAQTFLKAICQKYCPAFDTILLSGSADDALRLMAQQHVHVLVTDISMPGINGIELAQRVRQLYPRTHTVIVSGYAEFEFARGAIQAGVDDYLLKPVEIQSFRQILDRIRETLDAEANNLMEETLTRLLCGEAVDEPLLCSLFSSRMMRFALVRQGNLFTVRFAKFRTAQLRQVHQAGWIAFYGRDEQETILLRSSADRQKRFPDELSDLLKADFPDLPCTAIYAPEDADILTLPQFLSRAAGRMVNTVVISKGQLVPLIRDKNVSANELCEYTLNYIRENYAQPLSIPRICTDVGISQTYLSRLLRKYAGTTFNTFLTQCRMDAAKQMLRDHPDILLHEVAACVGYDDQSYFSKIFRNETGMTPSQYAATFAADAPTQPPKT